jgi:hypothetical protein
MLEGKLQNEPNFLSIEQYLTRKRFLGIRSIDENGGGSGVERYPATEL